MVFRSARSKSHDGSLCLSGRRKIFLVDFKRNAAATLTVQERHVGASQTTHDFAVNLSKQDKYLLYKNLPFCVVINSQEYFFH